MLGSWASAGRPADVVSILDGLKAAMPGCRIEHAPGVAIESADESGIAAAVELSARADVTILCLGEAAAMSGEAASRTRLDLPGRQRALAEAVFRLGRPAIVLISSGRPLALPWLFDRADAALATWFLGMEAGSAIADVLTGKFNPCGRLPVSWPRSVGQAPLFYSQRATGRPTEPGVHFSSSYIDSPATPQFPFGHGLSYSRFVLSDLRCDPSVVRAGGTIHVSVAVHNDSESAGESTLFLFVRDKIASVARPVLELKEIGKLRLEPNASGRTEWRLATAALAFVGQALETVLEPGQFDIHVGQSADPAGFLSVTIDLVA